MPLCVTPSDQVTDHGGFPVKAAWMPWLAPPHTVPPPETTAEAFDATICMTAAELLLPYVPSPPYRALSEWLPEVRAEVVKVAVPADSVPVPITVAPSRKLMFPVGVPPEPVTVEVKVTDCPEMDGF